MEWLATGVVALGVWIAMLSGQFGDLNEEKRQLVMLSPILAVIMFGVYSVAIIAYRVATFNDCEDAANEIQKQILEAREDLRSKGFQFEQTSS